jgi:hypothetical protein
LLAVILFCAGMFCLTQSNAQLTMTGAGGAGSGGGGAYTAQGFTSTARQSYGIRAA